MTYQPKEVNQVHNVSLTVHIFREENMRVGYVPELDLSSCGATDEEAGKNIQEAVQGFLETSRDMSTLNEVLGDAGYVREGDTWRAPEFISLDRFTTSLK